MWDEEAEWQDSMSAQEASLARAWEPTRSDSGESTLRPLRPHDDEGLSGPWCQELASIDEIDSEFDFSLHLGFDGGMPAGPRDEGLDQPGSEDSGGARRRWSFPVPGQIVSRFRILGELGRGAFARVYLAKQTDLADRPVALKVAAPSGEEPQNLARLQHAHIVPIHSVHDDPESGMRLICMPYLGGANLAQILRKATEVEVGPVSRPSGRSLIIALDELNESSRSGRPTSRRNASAGPDASLVGLNMGAPSEHDRGGASWRSRSRSKRCLGWFSRRSTEFAPAEWPQGGESRGPARSFLSSASLVRASAWIAARLAEGLEHAHERGILHRDIKPANVLVTADGTPMLLDFNLSTRSVPGAPAEPLGGTLVYMSPEHLDAFDPKGKTRHDAVGVAADIYSLGIVLFEMCTNCLPFSEPAEFGDISATIAVLIDERKQGPPSARSINPEVPWGLDSIIQKCLAFDPESRYARAGDLAEDLRRFLEDEPQLFAPERSLRERFQKWSRRHPRASSSTSIGIVAMLLITLLGFVGWSLRRGAEAATARLQHEEFTREFRECQLLLRTESGPESHLPAGIVEADRCLSPYQIDPSGLWLEEPLVSRLVPKERAALLRDVSELIQLEARAKARVVAEEHALPEERNRVLQEGIDSFDLAEAFDPAPSPALYRDRAALHRLLGQAREAKQDQLRAETLPLRTARDHDLLGTSLLAGRQWDRAEVELNKAVELDPQRFWSWFSLGMAHYEQKRYLEASYDFGVCSVLAPDFAWPHQNRGLALAAANRLPEARAAFDRALELQSNFVEALVGRALTCLELNEVETAEHDLHRAIELGRHEPAIRVAHAEALARLGRVDESERDFSLALGASPDDVGLLVARGFARLEMRPEDARADFDRALKIDANNPRARLGIARLLRATDPSTAIELLDRALENDPEFGDALQLRALLLAHQGDSRAVLDVDRLERTPTPQRLYNAACALAVLYQETHVPAHADRAVEVLGRALLAGFDVEQAARDDDFSALRDRQDFQALLRPRGALLEP